jgi:hypothetical protein
MRFNSFKRRRKWVRFKQWLGRKFDPEQTELTSEQDKAIKIAKKLIIDGDSALYADISGDRLIIENGARFVRITTGKLRIIDGPYKYDITFDPRRLNDLKKLFARNLEHRHDRLEAEIGTRVETSLDHILKDIENGTNIIRQD